jgi:NADPH:quinone reductase-like Zn-dependent oxidoreductase
MLSEAQLAALMEMYGKGELQPHVDRTFPFTAAAAHLCIHDRKSKGRVLLVPDGRRSADRREAARLV